MKFKDVILQNLGEIENCDLLEIKVMLDQLVENIDKDNVILTKTKLLIKSDYFLGAVRYYKDITGCDLNKAKEYCKSLRDSMILCSEMEKPNYC